MDCSTQSSSVLSRAIDSYLPRDLDRAGIYRIRNLVNGKCYVGSSVNIRKRWHVHRSYLTRGVHHNRYLTAAWNKYGQDAFTFEVIEYCAKESLIEREQHYIDTLRPEYNLSPTAGNCLGVKHSEAVRLRRSEMNRGNKFSIGRKLSEEHKRAVAEANRNRKGYKRDPDSVEKTAAAHRGRRRSEETRRRIAQAMSGKKRAPFSEETRRKLSLSLKGKQKPLHVMAALQEGRARQVFTEERRQKVAETIRRQYALGIRSREKSEEHRHNLGRAFAKLSDEQVREIRALRATGVTGKELAERYGSNVGTISAICNGKRYSWVV